MLRDGGGRLRLDPATREGRRPGGLMAAGLKSNEAVAPPCFGIGIGIAIEIVTEGRRPGGLMAAGLKGNEAVAPLV